MTENEAIERIRDHFEVHHHDNRPHPLLDEAVEMAIKALEEVQQYRQICTPEVLALATKLVNIANNCGTIGKVIDEWVDYKEIGTVEECRKAVEKQMEPIDYTALYADNADFKRYVDRYCVKHRISVAEALQHYLVQIAGRMYKEQMDNKVE